MSFGRTAATLVALVFALAACSRPAAKDEAPPPFATDSSAPTSQPRPQALLPPPLPKVPETTPWNDPRRACYVLHGRGLYGNEWLRNSALPPEQNRYCPSETVRPAADPSYEIAYRAVGDDREARAFVLRMRGPKASPKLADARAEFAEAVAALAESGWHMAAMQPAEAKALKAAVKAGAPGSWPAGGFARVEVTQAAKESEALTVTFFDPRKKPQEALGALP